MQMNKQPLVSVVIACYNHQNFVQESIQSVIDQTYEKIELIIIDDGSKDDSVKKINEMIPACKERFTRFEFRHRPNKGLNATLNEALEWCEGEYYSPFASDDKMLPDKTKKQVEILLEDQTIVGVFGAIQAINNDNDFLKAIRQPNKVFEFNDLIYTDSFLPAPTQMLKLDKVIEVGGYRDNLIIEDWYIYLKLLENGHKLVYRDDILAYYRVHGENTFSNPIQMAIGRLQVLSEFQQHDLFKKAYLKVTWDNALETLIRDFKLSIMILFSRIFHKFKIFLKKFI